MNTDYTKYTADRLLSDDYFLHSELYPTEQSVAFWNRLLAEHPALAKEIDVARLFLHSVRQACGEKRDLPNDEVERLRMTICRQNRLYRRRKRLLVAVGVAVAICLMLGGGGGYFYFARQAKRETDFLTLRETFGQIAGNDYGQVQLVLSDNRRIDVDGKDSQINYSDSGYVDVNSAQILSVAPASSETIYNQLIVPQGKRSAITFGDGTRVWINSGSRIIYPVGFEKDRRELFVEGEIFLDVAKDEKRPFVVKTGGMDIKVLGTTFNVKACGGDSDCQVVLVCGKVEVELNGNRSVLSPNQMFSYDARTSRTSVSSVDAADYIAWKDGYYLFRQQPLSAILNKLAEYYGTAFKWDERVCPLTCSGKLDLKEDLDEVLHALEKTAPIRIRRSDGEEGYEIIVKP